MMKAKFLLFALLLAVALNCVALAQNDEAPQASDPTKCPIRRTTAALHSWIGQMMQSVRSGIQGAQTQGSSATSQAASRLGNMGESLAANGGASAASESK